MPQEAEQKYVYQFPWATVIAGYQRRFHEIPNSRLPDLLGVDCLDFQFDDEQQCASFRQKIKVNIAFPYWLKRVSGVYFVILNVITTINRKEQYMTIETENDSLRALCSMHEICRYEPHPDNPGWTLYTQKATLSIKPFMGLESKAEQYALKLYVGNTAKARKVDTMYINELLSGPDEDLRVLERTKLEEFAHRVVTERLDVGEGINVLDIFSPGGPMLKRRLSATNGDSLVEVVPSVSDEDGDVVTENDMVQTFESIEYKRPERENSIWAPADLEPPPLSEELTN